MKPTKNNNSPYFFTLEELEFLIDSLYYGKLSYEEKSMKYRRMSSEHYLEGYYESSYKPMQAKFDNVRNKCTEIIKIMKEEKKSKGVK